jgi:hypothetical protein
MLVCAMAMMFPANMVAAAMIHRTGVISTAMDGKAIMNTRSRAAKPAAFAPADMNAVTAVGAPWYTSGVHIWKGTAATLNPNPTRSKAAPNSRRDVFADPVFMADTMAYRLVLPVAPKVSAVP